MALCAESAILGKGRRYLGGLEQHLPDIFVRRVEELSQRLVFGWVELPHIECPSLTRKDPAEEHDLDHIDKLDLFGYHVFTQFWSPVSSAGAPQAKPFFSQEVSRMGMPDQNSGAAS